MALAFGTAVMQIEANDDQLRRDLKEAERLVETSTANMQADLSSLTAETKVAGQAMGGTSEAAGALAASFSLVGGRAGVMGGQLVSLSIAMRAMVISTAAADAAIVSFGRAALIAVLPLAKIAAVIAAIAAVGFAAFKGIEFLTGTKEAADQAERAEEILLKSQDRLASRQLAKISEAKVLAEQEAARLKIVQEEIALQKQVEAAEQKELKVVKDKAAAEKQVLDAIEAQRDAKRAAFVAAAGPQTAAGAQQAIADLIRLNQGQQKAMRLLKEAAASIGPNVTKFLTEQGLLGGTPDTPSSQGTVGFVRAGAFSTATLASGSLGAGGGQKQDVKDVEGNGLLRQQLTVQRELVVAVRSGGGGVTSQ